MTRSELLDEDPIRRKYVYFIGNDEAVKIGFSTDMNRRLTDFHRVLASERLRGEWFRATDKTMDLVYLISDFLEIFDDNDEDTDGRDTHVLTMDELDDIQARPYWWRTE